MCSISLNGLHYVADTMLCYSKSVDISQPLQWVKVLNVINKLLDKTNIKPHNTSLS